jgi:hypothetical protein
VRFWEWGTKNDGFDSRVCQGREDAANQWNIGCRYLAPLHNFERMIMQTEHEKLILNFLNTVESLIPNVGSTDLVRDLIIENKRLREGLQDIINCESGTIARKIAVSLLKGGAE